MRSFFVKILTLSLLFTTTYAAKPDPLLSKELDISKHVEDAVHASRMRLQLPPPKIKIETSPALSRYTGTPKNTIYEGRWNELPAPVQGIFSDWASKTSDEHSGEELFADMFYQFFFVHEMGHWLQAEDMTNHHASKGNHWQRELGANRISVAWWREHDPGYMKKLAADFDEIYRSMPNPVPDGKSPEQYFEDNYTKLGVNPQVYGWFQLKLVLTAYDEPPQTFSQALQQLQQPY